MPDSKHRSVMPATAAALSAAAPDARAVSRRFALECDCGSEHLTKFGPYTDDVPTGDGEPADPGLRWVFKCRKCGEGVRIYATSPAWRAKREALPDGFLVDGMIERMERAYAMGFEKGRLTFSRGEELAEGATSAERHGFQVEQNRAREVNEAEARGFERGRARDTLPPGALVDEPEGDELPGGA